MKSAWSDEEATAAVDRLRARFPGRCDRQIALRIYTSQLIGREPRLVLHGGGNTSVKTALMDDLGDPCEVLCVKGSGWDLATLDVPGLPALRLRPLQALRRLDRLSDSAMVNAARIRLLDATAPNPSVEVLLHAFLRHTFIDHSHADAILSLVSQTDALSIIDEVYGDRLAVVPYVMPGFALAKLAAEIAEANPNCEGLLLLQHGLFTFGADARESYERHISAVTAAEAQIARVRVATGQAPAKHTSTETETKLEQSDALRSWTRVAATLRGALRDENHSYILHLRRSLSISAFLSRPREQLLELTGRGPVTPDHVIRTKPRPLVLDLDLNLNLTLETESLRTQIDAALADYRAEYRAYFARQTSSRNLDRIALDADPRVLLIPGLGLVGVGIDERAARIAADLYEHTITVISDAEVIGHHQALPECDIFDMEYWPLEQAKLGRQKKLPLSGKVVIISGAAGGIGLACARRFADQGAALWLIDRDGPGLEAATKTLGNLDNLAIGIATVDIVDRQAVEATARACVARFGGIDGIIANA
ncbi:MAG TPA: SDR family NAD(P)-dependent oxidoreductase, partial [Nannocystis exedens]|nr:SDR family NAD(P)-dependent oxidoreductase [Nannocystis exedens]